nr:exo-alpha-sialidase [Cytophagales bacterium]
MIFWSRHTFISISKSIGQKSPILFFLVFFGGYFSSWSQVLSTPEQVVLHIGKEGNNPRNSEGSFIRLLDGTILFVYSKFESGADDHASAYLAGRFSSDGGNIWSDRDEVIIENEGGMNVMSASFLRLRDGAIAIFYARKNSVDDCIPFMRISWDEAKTWSDPIKVIPDKEGYFVLNNDRVIQLENGRLMAPVSLHKIKGSDFNMKGRIYCYYSDDNGKSWTSSQEVPNPEGVILQEPGVVLLKNGEVKMWMRTDTGVQYLTQSQNDGRTWEQVQPSGIASPRSPASIKRIPTSDDLLLIWNNNTGSDKERASFRTPLTAAISTDDGKSWSHHKLIEDDPDGFFCYTAIEFVGEQVLLGYMAAERTGLREKIPLVIRKIPLNEFYK